MHSVCGMLIVFEFVVCHGVHHCKCCYAYGYQVTTWDVGLCVYGLCDFESFTLGSLTVRGEVFL